MAKPPIDQEFRDPIILHLDLENLEFIDLGSLFQIACENEQFAEADLIRKAIIRSLDAIEKEAKEGPKEEEEEDDEDDDDENWLNPPELNDA